ncbi:LysR family transcriptional regulator [Microbacterium album]|uniref:LysR family transcriptional regulator n=1 Tax=Microbacterium album TaxID=2053191 RepID=A0A917IEF1_9MICO|nr:LysR family transcriptional regulator [Microbacterium album]GGH38094.1 LysR family transcriptional regulator [Microbacterium album]
MRSPLSVNADDLRLLIAVARTGRMVAAAAALGLDHTTIGRRIRRLEADLGATLLVRSTDGWELTELGRMIADRANEIDVIVDEVRGIAAGEAGALRGTVRIAAPDGFGTAFVAPVLARVLREHPGVTPELVTSSRPVSARGTGFDLSVNIGAPPSGRVASEHLTRYTLGLFASRSYLAERGPVTAQAHLSRHPLVFYVESLLSVEELDLLRSFSGPRMGLGSTNVLAQVAATRAGAGIGLLPHFLAGDGTGAGTPQEAGDELVPVLPREVRFDLEFSLSVRRESRDSDVVAVVRRELHREVAERRGELLGP